LLERGVEEGVLFGLDRDPGVDEEQPHHDGMLRSSLGAPTDADGDEKCCCGRSVSWPSTNSGASSGLLSLVHTWLEPDLRCGLTGRRLLARPRWPAPHVIHRLSIFRGQRAQDPGK
jgi:hypothetical protein